MKWISMKRISYFVLFLTPSLCFSAAIDTSGVHWFANAGLGEQFPHYKSHMEINNGSGASPPFNQDIYTTRHKRDGLFTLAVGKYWQRDQKWLPDYSLGIFYEHTFTSNIGRQIIQYSDPEFTNYAYNWDVYTDVFMAMGKVNLFNLNWLAPYLLGGIGISLNVSDNYAERALDGVSAPRTSAGFRGNTTYVFAYAAGAGLEIKFTKQILMSLEYQYQNLGNVELGHGSGTWSGEILKLGTWKTNVALLNLTYLFDI